MAKVAVVFSGRSGLDVCEFRRSVVRIPQVTLRLREAQRIIDELDLPKIDLLNLLISDDEFFFRDIQLKSLVAAIVQVGLYDRYLRNQPRPHVMIGNSNGDSAMLVCSGRQTFREMILTSPAVVGHTSLVPVLSGLTLPEFHAFELVVTDSGAADNAAADNGAVDNGFEYSVVVPGGSMELDKLVAKLFSERGLKRFVNIGPSCSLGEGEYRALSDGEIESIDSIELDPLLGWFWRGHCQTLQLVHSLAQ